MPTMSTSKDNPVTAAYARGYLEKLTGLLGKLDPLQVEAVGRLLHRARAEGRQVFLMGNGGSAALASTSRWTSARAAPAGASAASACCP